MWQTILNAFRDKDIRRRIFLTFGILLIFRIGCYIPVPFISYVSLRESMASNTLLELMSIMSGGALQFGTLFSLGILPFINSFIIMQLLTLIIPKLDRLSKQGDEGREKITKITRYVAIFLAVVQGIGIVITYNNSGAIEPLFGSIVLSCIFIIVILTAGSTLVMWLGERITEYGIGNGTSLIIFVGIVSTLGTSLISAFGNAFGSGGKPIFILNILGYLLLIV